MGARLGRYEVLKHLASGGMADVLLGRADGIEGFERHVVLKRIKPEHAHDQRFIRMFLGEARVAANLHHQHIVQVHDVGESSGEYFIAMEYLHGEDVRAILLTAAKARQHVPLGYAMAIVSAAAAGLHYAHERRGPDKKPLGIVHRDVSPSNILVGYDGSIKVVDFGIAKASATQETRNGGLKGKISYMSPEQCMSGPVDRRSDIYALGIVLYELATTTRLFKGESDYLVMDQIVNGRIPLPQLRRPDLPTELSAIIMKAIARDPERRYATADELRIALDQFANEIGLTASTSAISTYLRQQFGDKPEPWIEITGARPAPPKGALGGVGIAAGAGTAAAPPPLVVASAAAAVAAAASPAADAAAVPEAGGWTPLWRADDPARFATGTRPPAADMGSVVTGDVTIQLQAAPPEVQAVPRAIPRLPSASTESKMGWESQRPPRSPGRMSTLRFALFAVPLIALIVVGLWLLVGPDPAAPVAPAAAPGARPPPAPAAKTIAPAPDTALPRGGNAPVTPAGAHARPEPHSELRPDPAAAEPSRRSSSRHATAAKVVETRVSAAPAPAEAPASAQAAAPPAAPAPMPASNGAAPPQTAPAFPPMPATPRPAMSRALVATLAPLPAAPPSPAPTPAAAVSGPVVLSRAAIERVAADHTRALSKCDAGEPLHGEIAVHFLVDAQGKVDKAQLAMPLRKPKVAACILRLVQKWQFPPQPASGAQGTYTLSFR